MSKTQKDTIRVTVDIESAHQREITNDGMQDSLSCVTGGCRRAQMRQQLEKQLTHLEKGHMRPDRSPSTKSSRAARPQVF